MLSMSQLDDKMFFTSKSNKWDVRSHKWDVIGWTTRTLGVHLCSTYGCSVGLWLVGWVAERDPIFYAWKRENGKINKWDDDSLRFVLPRSWVGYPRRRPKGCGMQSPSGPTVYPKRCSNLQQITNEMLPILQLNKWDVRILRSNKWDVRVMSKSQMRCSILQRVTNEMFAVTNEMSAHYKWDVPTWSFPSLPRAILRQTLVKAVHNTV